EAVPKCRGLPVSARLGPIEKEGVHLPFAHGMRNGNLEGGALCRVVEVSGKESLWLEKMRLPRDVLLDPNRLSGHTQFLQLRHNVLLLRLWIIHSCLWAQMIREKGGIMIHGEALN